MKSVVRGKGASGSRGAVMLEPVLAAGLIALLAGAAFMAADTVQTSYRAEFVASGLEEVGGTVVERVVDRLRPLDFDGVDAEDLVGTVFRSVKFQRLVLPGQPAEPSEWFFFEYEPTDPDDGRDNDGDGLVDEGRLVHVTDFDGASPRRRIVASSVAENAEGEIPGNGKDDNGNGYVDEPGLFFDLAKPVVTFHMSLLELDGQGHEVWRTVQRTIALRNTSEEVGP